MCAGVCVQVCVHVFVRAANVNSRVLFSVFPARLCMCVCARVRAHTHVCVYDKYVCIYVMPCKFCMDGTIIMH